MDEALEAAKALNDKVGTPISCVSLCSRDHRPPLEYFLAAGFF